ncbi:MAG: class I SAM-dependent methyltransferase [Candidatus Omnitrophota bacterium]|nr:class I SAM-dependent methyltransferase [Candidatus Omnitrophota bacterium]
MTQAASSQRKTCRLCGGNRLQQVLSLAKTPLANAFVPESAKATPQPLFPLDLHLCLGCGHLQLLEIVRPEVLFEDYVYVSGTSPLFIQHFKEYAEEAIRLAGLKPGDQVIDIGSNDGTLLGFFKEKGMKVLGIDPARKISEEAARKGIPTLTEFFTPALAQKLRREGWQPAVITANNVFAHADDLAGIAQGVRHLLRPDGLFMFEVSYLLDVFEKGLFDTIYHEHLSYHAVKPLIPFFRKNSLRLTGARRVESHGGSLRGIVRTEASGALSEPEVELRIAQEEGAGLFRPEAYETFSKKISDRGKELKQLLLKLKKEGKRIAGFGAPAKATTLLYHFGLGPDLLEAVIDDSPWKQGLYTPGHHIPVVPAGVLSDPKNRPDYCLILAWNFADPIIKKHEAYRQAGGRFIVPLPELTIR